MKLEYRRLEESEIQEVLATMAEWRVENGLLTRTFTFDGYAQGVLFAVGVANEAERLNHHPDILIGYAKVTVSVNTHDVKGISPYDFELARRITR